MIDFSVGEGLAPPETRPKSPPAEAKPTENDQCLPPGGRGTAKRWKEPAGTKATACLLKGTKLCFLLSKQRYSLRFARSPSVTFGAGRRCVATAPGSHPGGSHWRHVCRLAGGAMPFVASGIAPPLPWMHSSGVRLASVSAAKAQYRQCNLHQQVNKMPHKNGKLPPKNY